MYEKQMWSFLELNRDAIRSSWRRMVWKLQKILGMDARWPVLWSKFKLSANSNTWRLIGFNFAVRISAESKLKSLPSQQFTQTLNALQQEQLSSIITEVEVS